VTAFAACRTRLRPAPGSGGGTAGCRPPRSGRDRGARRRRGRVGRRVLCGGAGGRRRRTAARLSFAPGVIDLAGRLFVAFAGLIGVARLSSFLQPSRPSSVSSSPSSFVVLAKGLQELKWRKLEEVALRPVVAVDASSIWMSRQHGGPLPGPRPSSFMADQQSR